MLRVTGNNNGTWRYSQAEADFHSVDQYSNFQINGHWYGDLASMVI